MKRFYGRAEAVETDLGWQVELDGRPVKTQGGKPQLAPTEPLAEILVAEWRGQSETIDPAAFPARDLADYALDVVAQDKAAAIERLLRYAETETLCYRANPGEPLWRHQREVWDPLVEAFEAREGVAMQRASGVIPRPQPREALERLRARLARLDHFTLAALETLTSLAASLCIGLAALEPDADGEALWNAANLEEDWQAEQWGVDEEAAARRENRRRVFLNALDFARAARTG